MINFHNIESQIQNLSKTFKNGVIESVIIDDFLKSDSVDNIFNEFPNPIEAKIQKSRDYVFAKNKFEKSDLASFGINCSKLREELLSDRFKEVLKKITGENVFVDSNFHGGGLHQGGKGSFLNLHTDFNYHPLNHEWFRNLNILIYFNKNWTPEYGGELKIQNKNTGKSMQIEPIFNRCVIMFTRDYTLHGYDPISFPDGEYRRSIAAYAYSLAEGKCSDVRSTTWYPENTNILKRTLGKNWPKLVSLKTKVFGSSTVKNK
jgi:Rps23 Pro-64 3,4-dihydroxylase Tpa1-like proline 4-hydroxylase